MRTDPYSDLRLFLRVIELGAIRPAAREIGVEPSSLSRRMTGLETRLGARLLDRTGPRAQPTAAGRVYYEHLRALLPQLDAADAEVAGEADRPRGRLRVNAPIDFGQRHVAGWLLDFRASYPEVEVELDLSSSPVNLTASGTEVAIRVGAQPDSQLMARRLAWAPRVLVAAPDYIARAGLPACPQDLATLDHVFFRPENRHRPLRLTGPDGREHLVERRGGVTLNAVASIVTAIERGHGVHLGPLWAFAAALAAGRVVELLPGYSQPAMPVSAVWTPAVVQPARIRAFVEFAARAIRDVPGLKP